MVKTCRRNGLRRSACEQTWVGKLRELGYRVYFLTGGYHENRIVSDTLYVTWEAYCELSLKVRDGVSLMLAFPFDHLFICDDDTFVHWRRWHEFEPQADLVGLETKKHPWIHGGAGWYMSREACRLYVEGMDERCSGDDKLCTPILSRAGIWIDNHPELFSQWEDRVTPANTLITCHHVSPDEMHDLYTRNSE